MTSALNSSACAAPGHDLSHSSPRQRLVWLASRDETLMAYGVVHHFPGGTKEQYEASVAAVHPGPGSCPTGRSLHVAGASPSGWTIIAVHDSRELESSATRSWCPGWRRDRGRFPTPPEETTVDVDTMLP